MTNRQVIQSGLLAVLVAVAASGWVPRASGQQGQQLVPRAVLKLIIGDPALVGYLHPEIAGRVPLVISDHLLAPGVTPSKFGQPVRILRDREVGSQPHIRFQSFEVQGAQARTVIEYKAESLEMVFTLESTASGWWRVVDAKIANH